MDDIEIESHKTKDLYNVIEAHGWADRETLLITRNDMPENLRLAAGNIKDLLLLPVDGLNVYNILHCRNLVISSKVLKEIYYRVEGMNSDRHFDYDQDILGKDPFEGVYLGEEECQAAA